MAELADALDSKSGSFGSVGSTPTLGTKIISHCHEASPLLFGLKHLCTIKVLAAV